MVALTILVSSACPMFAADDYKNEVFGGYSLLKGDGGISFEPAHGWTASYSRNVHRKVGVVGEISQYYNSGSILILGGGPQFNLRRDKATFFVRALLGMIDSSNGPETAFLMSYGAGIDVKAGETFDIRIVQADWTPIKVGDDPWDRSTVRFTAGVKFKFGAR
jgi:hypothetical protein